MKYEKPLTYRRKIKRPFKVLADVEELLVSCDYEGEKKGKEVILIKLTIDSNECVAMIKEQTEIVEGFKLQTVTITILP